MTRRPPRCTRPEPLLPSTSCFRSFSGDFDYEAGYVLAGRHDGSSGTIQVVAGARLEIRNGEGVNEDTTEPGLTLAFEEGSIGNLVVDGDGSMIELTQVPPSDTGNGTFGPFLQVGRLGGGNRTVDRKRKSTRLNSSH